MEEFEGFSLKCNICDGKMRYVRYNGTHIWICNDCANIQIEYYEDKNITDLQNYITETENCVREKIE